MTASPRVDRLTTAYVTHDLPTASLHRGNLYFTLTNEALQVKLDLMRQDHITGGVTTPHKAPTNPDQLAAGYVTRTMSDGSEAEFIAVAPGYHSLGYWFLPGMRRSDINIFNPGPTIIPVMVDAQLQPGRLYRAEVEYDGASRNLRLWLRDLRTGEVVGSMHIT